MSAPAEFMSVAQTRAEEAGLALTPMQREAVAFRNGNVLVEAVPGSGKTRVIVAGCLALLAEAVAPSEILLLTFSRRAVGELRARLARSLEPDRMPEIRTFHGFAAGCWPPRATPRARAACFRSLPNARFSSASSRP